MNKNSSSQSQSHRQEISATSSELKVANHFGSNGIVSNFGTYIKVSNAKENGEGSPSSPAQRRVLFIDRDGTLIKEAPPTYQLDSFPKLEFYKHMFEYMTKIASELNYELVMVTNQDGLGTSGFPEE